MKRLIKCSIDISLKNWPTLLVFNMLYKMFSYSILYSVTGDLLELLLKTSGVSYLSAENASLILQNPVSVLLCLGMVFLAAVSVFFEAVALYVYCENGWQQNHISIVQLAKQTLIHCKKLLHIQNLLLFLGFILMTVLTVLPFSPYILRWLSVPEFIMEFIKNNVMLFSAFIVIAVIANLTCFLFLFFLPGTLFQNQSMKAAWKDGLNLLEKRKAATMLRILAAFAVFSIAAVVLIILATIGLVCYTKYAEVPVKAAGTFVIYYYRAVPAVLFILNSLSTIWLFSLIISLYHQYREDIRPLAASHDKIGLFSLLKQAAVIVSAASAILIFSETELGGSFITEIYNRPQIVAHRSGAAYAPENTLAALEHAIDMKIDMVEIDVQQLKDGELIILHDDSFNRTTGVNKKVWEVVYDEVKHYDAGSWFSPRFTGEPVPTLEEFLKRARNHIKVMIELKSTGHEKNLVEGVVSLIDKYDMLDQCNIGSLNLELLKEVKAINPRIETVYITPLIYSIHYDIDFIDAFSVETTMLTREMVVSMHGEGKEVYGWTANSEETIEKNLRCQVDGIVTDKPELVSQYVMQTWHNRLLSGILRIFFDTALSDANLNPMKTQEILSGVGQWIFLIHDKRACNKQVLV